VNRVVVLVVGYVLMGLELGLREFLRLGPSTSAPSFVIPLVVFVALLAPPLAAMWTALLAGLVVDLATARGDAGTVVVGPHALGFLAAAWAVLAVRAVLLKRNPLTLMVVSGVAAAISGLVVVALLGVRLLYTEALGFRPLEELGYRMLSALLTMGSGLALSAVLFPMQGWFGFQDPMRRGFTRRS
jgi:rod shape-determining protein MreD